MFQEGIQYPRPVARVYATILSMNISFVRQFAKSASKRDTSGSVAEATRSWIVQRMKERPVNH